MKSYMVGYALTTRGRITSHYSRPSRATGAGGTISIPLGSSGAAKKPSRSDGNFANEQAFVQLKLVAHLQAENGTLQLPSEIMERLTDQEPLTQLEVTTGQRPQVTQVNAQFRFTSMATFTSWYERQQTRYLRELIEEKSGETVALMLGMKRE